MRFASSLLLVALSVPCVARAQRTAATPVTVATKSGASRPADTTSFSVGKRIYLRSSGTFIGTIIDKDDNHDFRDGHFPRPWMKAVLIVRRDGPYEWMPVEGLARLYVAR